MMSRQPSRQYRVALATIVCILAAGSALAQPPRGQLDAKARGEVVDALVRELNRAYVFPEKAVTMARHLRARMDAGAYNELVNAAGFAETLTKDLQQITRDKHLRVVVSGERPARSGSTPESRPFGERKRLPGAVAYIEIRSFGFSADDVRDEVREVMSEAADASALVLDVRANGGGSPSMVALVSSYLFGSEPVHLNSLYWRVQNRTDDFFTDPKVAGSKFGSVKPVYVLTSARTFSAAEEFTYNLQTRKRATIVGETTGGGAHPGGTSTLPHGLRVFVPSGRAINPITGTNWEGTGVIPDVAVAASDALETALRLARGSCRQAPCKAGR